MQLIKSAILIAIFSFILSTPSLAQLSGPYTVGSGTTLPTINSAVEFLINGGVLGTRPVIFNILPGTYTEQITILEISGTTLSAPVIFRASTGDFRDVEIRHIASGPEDNWVVYLNGSSNIAFEDLSFSAFNSGTYCRVFDLRGATNVRIQNCVISGNITNSASDGQEVIFAGIHTTLERETSFLSLISNTIYFGAFGVELTSFFQSGPQVVNNVIRDNQFINQYQSAISLSNQVAPTIDGNRLTTDSPNTGFTGIDVDGWKDRLQITGNQINLQYGLGMSIVNGIGQSDNHGLIANNFIKVSTGNPATSIETAVGAFLKDNAWLDFYHNSIYASNGGATFNSALWISGSVRNNPTNIINNIIASPTGYVYYVDSESALNSIGSSQSNAFDATGSNFFASFHGSDYSDLQSWQKLTGSNSNSVQTSVNFASVSGADLHLAGASLSDKDLLGIPLPITVTRDFDGEIRNVNNPKMGADEASAPVSLPVELVSFAADVAENAVTLSWQTATETGNFGFEVERSSDAEPWQKMAFVPGAGTTVEVQHYEFADNNIKAGTYYYRLRQVDTDGSFDYSGEIKVTVGGPQQFALGQNYPNPFNPTTVIEYTLPEAANVELSIVNVRGELVRQLVADNMTAGSYHISWNGRDENGTNVASGSYFYLLKAGGKTLAIKKMLLLR